VKSKEPVAEKNPLDGKKTGGKKVGNGGKISAAAHEIA
jgi:hypothetical protein